MTRVCVNKKTNKSISLNFSDSIIYKYAVDDTDARKGDPLETGEDLGDMVDEFPNHTILEFVGGSIVR